MWFRNIFNARQAGASTRAAGKPAGASLGGGLLNPQALRMLNHLTLNTAPLLPGQSSGARQGGMRRPASEFQEHRQYVPGDDVRYVDWKASARQEHVFIKQNADPKAELVYLLLDCSASMTWGRPPKAETALALANLLGYLALSQQDRLVVLPVTAAGPVEVPLLGPLWGKGQAALLNRSLRALPFGGQVDLSRTLAGLSRRKHSRGGMVLVLSDLLGTQGLSKALVALPTPNWKVVICHLLHPDELNPPLNGHFEMQDIETGQKKRYPVTQKVIENYRRRLQGWRDQIAHECREGHATYTMIPTNSSITQDIIPELQRSQVVKRL